MQILAHQLLIPGRGFIDCTPEAAAAERQRGGVVRELVDAREVERLLALADQFDLYGSDQIESQRLHKTRAEKRDCQVKAEIWADAANELRTALAQDLPS